jgi:hypothetical protein
MISLIKKTICVLILAALIIPGYLSAEKAEKGYIYGYVKKNGQPVEDAGMNVWAIRIADGLRKDWPGIFTDSNGYYEHSWEANGFYIYFPPVENAYYYNKCTLPAKTGLKESNPRRSKDPYPATDPECLFRRNPGYSGWWWCCNFTFKTKP